jgi:hypothetical protein
MSERSGARPASISILDILFSIFFESIDGVCHVWAVFHHRRDPAEVAQRFSS